MKEVVGWHILRCYADREYVWSSQKPCIVYVDKWIGFLIYRRPYKSKDLNQKGKLSWQETQWQWKNEVQYQNDRSDRYVRSISNCADVFGISIQCWYHHLSSLTWTSSITSSICDGTVSGITVCLSDSHLLHTQTGGVGELSNFILGVCFVLPAGLIYKKENTEECNDRSISRSSPDVSSRCSFSNYFVVYPVYTNFMPNTGNSWSISGDQQECKDVGCIDLV